MCVVVVVGAQRVPPYPGNKYHSCGIDGETEARVHTSCSEPVAQFGVEPQELILWGTLHRCRAASCMAGMGYCTALLEKQHPYMAPRSSELPGECQPLLQYPVSCLLHKSLEAPIS